MISRFNFRVMVFTIKCILFSHSSHYTIIKYVGFESIVYAINLGIASSFKVFSEFDSMLPSNVLLV